MVKFIPNKITSVIDVIRNGQNLGLIDDGLDGVYRYFPQCQDKITGDDYIAVGQKLNELNAGLV
ncbi:hypothetical protein [Neptunomonas phycophila]|jgi:hypothetical protein|uniref:hypothetical protein n=1 Tax=Neptunomonas phycophila TaxID=1572645 RepID=UPI0035183EF8